MGMLRMLGFRNIDLTLARPVKRRAPTRAATTRLLEKRMNLRCRDQFLTDISPILSGAAIALNGTNSSPGHTPSRRLFLAVMKTSVNSFVGANSEAKRRVDASRIKQRSWCLLRGRHVRRVGAKPIAPRFGFTLAPRRPPISGTRRPGAR